MIRILLGSAVPLLAIGLAAASIGPSLFAPRGEPIVVAAPAASGFELASLDGEACASTRLLAGEAPAPDGAGSATRIVALALQSGPDHISVAIQEIPADAPGAGATILLLLDVSGRIVAVADAPVVPDLTEPVLSRDCGEPAPITLGSI